MRYLAFATDYDGTLAHHGVVDEPTLAAVDRVRASGRMVLMVTGRELDDLFKTFPHCDRFDRIVAENGALIYTPETQAVRVLTESPPERFITDLRRRGVTTLSVGRTIVATVEPYQFEMLDAIRELGMEWHVIFNKGAVMALPSGVTKATGLHAVLKELDIAHERVVGIGDAENDNAFLAACGCGVAVANALPSLKSRADWVTSADHGAGVAELIDRLLTDDLKGLGRAVETEKLGVKS
jgi:HAD superfamily hydrolase (TIGR01484 family)